MKEKSMKRVEHEYSPGQRLAALVIEAIFFIWERGEEGFSYRTV